MPTLDMSEVLESPEFLDYVTVFRETGEVNEFGEYATVSKPFKRVPMVITAGSKNDLEMGENFTSMPRSFNIVTKFRLQGPSPGVHPDKILHMGNMHKVTNVEPYVRYGRGFVQATMESIKALDLPPRS